ncbi:hypothetical protein Hanom_Chr17g01588811 [Helianthus anomalus]
MTKSPSGDSVWPCADVCKLCPLSSIITENVLDVCKPLQVMSFIPNLVNFCG